MKTNELLRQARAERGWTQRHLAQEVGVEEQTVRSWERGSRTPSLELRARLCNVLGKTPEQLGLRREETPRTEPLLLTPLPTTELSPSPPSPARLPNRDRERMVERVSTRWMRVLVDSLSQPMLIVLGLREQPEAVANPWQPVLLQEHLAPRPLPPGMRIPTVYDRADGELLILGEPGAGKTTLLLELLRDLLERARQDEAHPIPVLFHLSSWGQKRLPLTDWLVEELTTKYQVPEKLAGSWVSNDQLLLLLDGLDEVDPKDRSACIEAINTYRQAHGLVPVVVCSRAEAYMQQASRLLLQTAVVVQPLLSEQIDAYLAGAGEQLEALRQALGEDRELRQMVTTPLMLTIAAAACQGEERRAFLTAGSPEARRRQMLARYVERMLARRSGRTARSRSSAQQIRRSLAWLARQLVQHHQSEYYVERMQPDWLASKPLQQRYRASVIRLLYSIQIIINAALFSWLRGGSRGAVFGVGFGLLGELGAGPGNTILGWMAPGLGGGLGGGGSLGIIIAIISVLVVLLVRHPLSRLSWRSAWRGLSSGLKNGMLIAVLLGGFSGLVFYLSGWPDSLSRGIGIGLFSGLLTGLVAGLLTGLSDGPKPPARRSLHRLSAAFRLRHVGQRLVDVLIFSLCAGGSFGIVNIVIIGEVNEAVVLYVPIVGLFYGVVNAIAVEMHLLGDLDVGIQPAETVLWSWRRVRQDMRESVRKGIQVALWVMVSVGVSLSCASALFYGLPYGVRYGAIYGLIIGCVTGVAGVLSSILTSGWSSETLEAHEFGCPNEGIRRSGRNAVFAASLFGPIGGLVSGLVCGGAFGLLGGLSGWPVLGGGLALVLGVIFALVFATIHGGTAWIEHYVLRWYLWRTGYLPWRVIRLLDEAADRILLRKVGGGYMFIHALLQDYFASLGLAGADASEPERVRG